MKLILHIIISFLPLAGWAQKDTVKQGKDPQPAIKAGVFELKGKITANGKPVPGVKIKLRFWADGMRDPEISNYSSSDSGNYSIKLSVKNFYESFSYIVSFSKEGYHGKPIEMRLQIPEKVDTARFSVDVPVELVAQGVGDTTNLGLIWWSKTNHAYQFRWGTASYNPEKHITPGTFRLKGKVVSAGKPIGGARIEVFGPGDKRIDFSSEDGTYDLFIDVKDFHKTSFGTTQMSNLYRIEFSKEGFKKKQVDILPFIPEKTETESFEVSLPVEMVKEDNKGKDKEITIKWNKEQHTFSTY